MSRTFQFSNNGGGSSSNRQNPNIILSESMEIGECLPYANEVDLHSSISLEALDSFIESKMKEYELAFSPEKLAYSSDPAKKADYWSPNGRLGPSRVIFDAITNIGSLKTMGHDRLTLLGQAGFNSMKANVALFSGKWIYEVMLNSKGVMQVGWATHKCNFSQEQGVGDTKDSYAYDGNRVRKWNLTTYKYGDSWNSGDVIGCAIDLDNGCVDFYRNGKHLGQAFSRVRLGPGYAYFPAVSLAYGESLTANFGATPLRYPVDGYQPLEAIPYLNIRKADLMLDWLFTLRPIRCHQDDLAQSNNSTFYHNSNSLNMEVQTYLVANIILRRLNGFLINRYVTERCLLKKLLAVNDSQRIQHLLDILWALMEKPQIQECIDHLVISLVSAYHFSQYDDRISASKSSSSSTHHSLPDEYNFHGNSLPFGSLSQKQYLLVALSLVQHAPTRSYLLKHVLFDKIRFPRLFMDRTSFDDEILERKIFPHLSVANLMSPDAHKILKSKDIENTLMELESLHQMILDTLIFQDEMCREIFISKFDSLLQEMSLSLNLFRPQIPSVLNPNEPSPATLSIFHRLTSLIRIQYENMINIIPVSFFIDPSCLSADVCRTGGLVTHLNKAHEKEMSKYIENLSTENPLMKHVYILIDGLVRLYSSGAHKQLGKYCTIRENLLELADASEELRKLNSNDEETVVAIQNSVKVLEEELLLRARQLALINSTVLTPTKRADIYWLLKLLLNTLDHASSCGYLFSFVPDYHIESCLNLCYAIRFYFGPSGNNPSGQVVSSLRNNLVFTGAQTPDQKIEYQEILYHFCTFIASHYGDDRIVNTDLRESIAQALASLVSNSEALRTLENIPQPSRLKMLKSLTAPYENRAWGQSNWILLRMWKGDGFAFRYTSPSSLASKLNNPQTSKELFSNLSYLTPCPSPKFQKELAHYLSSAPEASNAFISSLLCQLNWSFSEFIGMLQEIQYSSNRPEKGSVDSRQLKICCTCFDLTLALLRVLEMIANIGHKLIVAPQNNDLILFQLCTTVNQILNRITVPTGCFEYVIDLDMIGLELVNHFPILSAVAGLLVALVLKGQPEDRESAINALVSDANFLPSSLMFLVGKIERSFGRCFRFEEFNEVSPQEIVMVNEAVNILISRHRHDEVSKSVEHIAEDDMCTICYANKKTARFVPCGHQSCKSCIATHFMRHQECFFCKAILDRVILTDSNQIIFPEGMSERS